MKFSEKELFGVAIRVVGLLSFIRGFFDILYIIFFALGALREQSVTKAFPDANLTYGIFYLLGGLYLLRGAPLLISFAFPDVTRAGESEDVGVSEISN